MFLAKKLTINTFIQKYGQPSSNVYHQTNQNRQRFDDLHTPNTPKYSNEKDDDLEIKLPKKFELCKYRIPRKPRILTNQSKSIFNFSNNNRIERRGRKRKNKYPSSYFDVLNNFSQFTNVENNSCNTKWPNVHPKFDTNLKKC